MLETPQTVLTDKPTIERERLTKIRSLFTEKTLYMKNKKRVMASKSSILERKMNIPKSMREKQEQQTKNIEAARHKMICMLALHIILNLMNLFSIITYIIQTFTAT